MSLVNQTCWVVGGVGVVGRGITRGLLQAGASVIVNSRSEKRLENLSVSLGNPPGLITVHGSLLPGRASKTVADTLASVNYLNHVVAHGAVRWWARPSGGSFEFYEFRQGCDETFSLNIKPSQRILDYSVDEFVTSSAQLASLHFSAAQELIPRLSQSSHLPSSYTFVTGDGSGKPGGGRTSMGEINSHHVWGLSAALRNECSKMDHMNVNCREIRVSAPIDPIKEEANMTQESPLSEDIGILCAGLASSVSTTNDDTGRLINITSRDEMKKLLKEYEIEFDENRSSLPHYYCNA